MFRVKESIHVNAPAERCFLLATSVPLVQKILGMRPVAGNTSGLIVNGERVLWRGWKFGLPARHETLITRYERPSFFQDTMASGMFQYFQHDHRFDDIDGHTFMSDIVRFSLPFGGAGHLVAKRIVVPHVLSLLQKRLAMLKRIAESDDWQQYIVADDLPPHSIQPL